MVHHQSRPARPQTRPSSSASPGSHITWLTDLDNQEERFAPIGCDDIVPEGAILPFKRIIDRESGRQRGRLGLAAENNEARRDGIIAESELLVFLLSRSRPPGTPRFDPDEANAVWRMTSSEVEQMMAHPSLDWERAKQFTGRGLAARFTRRSDYALSTMSSKRVLWAAVSIQYSVPVNKNTARLAHFQNSEVIGRLLSLGGVLYTNESKGGKHFVTYFVAFREPVRVSRLRAVESAMEISFDLQLVGKRARTIRRSYVDEYGRVNCVPGPVAGRTFNPVTGEALGDDVWRRLALVNPSVLDHLDFSPDLQVTQNPTPEMLQGILDAYGLTGDVHWGYRDAWAPVGGERFATVIPGKTYTSADGKEFLGETLTGRAYHDHLQRGMEFFATTRNREDPRWLCIDMDVAPIEPQSTSGSRFVVDRQWLTDHLDDDEIARWSAHHVYPEFRLSGRGFYIEFIFDEAVPRHILKGVLERALRVIRCVGYRHTDRKRICGETQDGFRVLQDVSTLTHLVRMPGSVHYTTGTRSRFLDGSVVPPLRRSCAASIAALLEITPSINTVASSLGVLSSQTNNESLTNDSPVATSTNYRALKFERDGHLWLNHAQRSILTAAIVDDLMQRRQGKRGPTPDRTPYRAAASYLVDQACRTSEPFPLGTRRIQSRISEVKGGAGERARNRAAHARAALEEAGYIHRVREHLRNGTIEYGMPQHGNSDVYVADTERLREMVREVVARRCHE